MKPIAPCHHNAAEECRSPACESLRGTQHEVAFPATITVVSTADMRHRVTRSDNRFPPGFTVFRGGGGNFLGQPQLSPRQ